MQKCPECRQWLDLNTEKCRCGWFSSEKNTDNSHQCVYVSSGRRCPLDGTNCSFIYGSGSWYCLNHFNNLQDKKRCCELLIYAEENFETIMDNRIDWRIKLIPEEYQIVKKRIAELYLIRVINKR
jgi:hypothetical protein